MNEIYTYIYIKNSKLKDLRFSRTEWHKQETKTTVKKSLFAFTTKRAKGDLITPCQKTVGDLKKWQRIMKLKVNKDKNKFVFVN